MEWTNRSKSIRRLWCAGLAVGVSAAVATLASSQPATNEQPTDRPAGPAGGQASSATTPRQPGSLIDAGPRLPATPTQPNHWTQITVTERGAWHVARFEQPGMRPAVAARAVRVQGPGSVHYCVEVAAWAPVGEVAPNGVPPSAIVASFAGASPDRLLEFLDTVEGLDLSATPDVAREREVRATMPGNGMRSEVQATVVQGRATVYMLPEAPHAAQLGIPADALREALRPAAQDMAALRTAPLALAVSEPFRAVVVGAFDMDGDGVATLEETQELVTVLESRGGTIIEELDAEVDYVVLGERPRVPQPPPANVRIEELSAWQRQDRAARRWEQVLEHARQGGITVLGAQQVRALFGV